MPNANSRLDERYRTVPTAAREMGIKVHALRRAIKNGDVPSYFPFGGRRYVLISEINTAIQASQVGGQS